MIKNNCTCRYKVLEANLKNDVLGQCNCCEMLVSEVLKDSEGWCTDTMSTQDGRLDGSLHRLQKLETSPVAAFNKLYLSGLVLLYQVASLPLGFNFSDQVLCSYLFVTIFTLLLHDSHSPFCKQCLFKAGWMQQSWPQSSSSSSLFALPDE